MIDLILKYNNMYTYIIIIMIKGVISAGILEISEAFDFQHKYVDVDTTITTNWGHRGGYDMINQQFPENSLSLLKLVLTGNVSTRDASKTITWKTPICLQNHIKFTYLEFDVRETKDNQLIVFHNNNIEKMIGNNPANDALLQSLNISKNARIKDLTLTQLEQFVLRYSTDDHVCSLETYVQKALEWGLRKPMVFDVKRLYSDIARKRLVDTIKFCVYNHKICNVSFPPAFDFPRFAVNAMSWPHYVNKGTYGNTDEERRKWFGMLYAAGIIGIMRAGGDHMENLSKKYTS